MNRDFFIGTTSVQGSVYHAGILLLNGAGFRVRVNIAAAPARSALKNGHADLQRYKRTKKQYGYTHDARAFLHIRDNLYLADARQVLRDYQADRVPVPPYEYDYEAPSAALLERVRRHAGNTPEYPHP